MANFFYFDSNGKLYHKDRDVSFFSESSRQGAIETCKGWNSRFANKLAGVVHKTNGYVVVKLFGETFTAHRIIFAIHHKRDIKEGFLIDHIDGNRSNNRIENLREVTPSQNGRNKKGHRDGTFRGVSFNKKTNKYVAYFTIGPIASMEDVKEIRNALDSFCGYHENHGN